MRTLLGSVAGLALAARLSHAQGATLTATLTATERALRDVVRADTADQIVFLAKATDIQSATMNVEGVRRAGARLRAVLDSLGFTTRWIDMSETERAGHRVADHRGKPGTTRILLIGHLDTVVEGDSLRWSRANTVGRGAGVGDMKGGDAIPRYALKAMHRTGTLEDVNVTVVLTGDEESAGDASFVAPVVAAMDGLGALGSSAHTPRETVSIPWLAIQTERSALLIHRLSRQTRIRNATV